MSEVCRRQYEMRTSCLFAADITENSLHSLSRVKFGKNKDS